MKKAIVKLVCIVGLVLIIALLFKGVYAITGWKHNDWLEGYLGGMIVGQFFLEKVSKPKGDENKIL